VLAKVRLGQFHFIPQDWKHTSDDAKCLIRALLKMSPKDRYTAQQALNHGWVKDKAPKATGAVEGSIVRKLRKFRAQNNLKKAALHVIASQLGENEIQALRDTFIRLDGNGDGLLTVSEMKKGLENIFLKEVPSDLQQIMEDVDADHSGVIDYTEFLAATLDKKVYMVEDVCWQAFRIFDRNNDGRISKDDMHAVLTDDDVQSSCGLDIEEMMHIVDSNDDGTIDFQEFMEMMRDEPLTPASRATRAASRAASRSVSREQIQQTVPYGRRVSESRVEI
jgi:calcium-dependent protein kinase